MSESATFQLENNNTLISDQARKTKISNFIGIILGLIIFPYTFYFNQSVEYEYLAVACLLTSITFLTIPLINHLKKTTFARYLLIILSTFSVGMFSIILEAKSHIFIFFFPIILLPLLFFTYKQRTHIIISYFIIFTGLVCDISYKIYQQDPAIANELMPLVLSNIIFCFLLICVYSFTILKQKQYFHENLEKKNQELLSQITVRRQTEASLREAKSAAEAMSKSKENFLSSMSHELRTPLNAVIGITNLLIDSDPKKEQVENLNIMKFSADSLLSLINDILDYNKISAGKLDIEHIPFNLVQHLKNIKEANTFKATERNNTIKLMVDPAIPKILKGDPTRVAQVINNLLSNAVKFTEEGLIEIRVFMNESIGDNHITFEVEDQGVGIHPENIDKIFMDFEQAESSTTRKFGGTGLGLSITKKLLRLMNSNIEVSSTLGAGSTFRFTLELLPSSEEEYETLTKLDQEEETVSYAHKKILLVEDNPFNVKVATQFLKNWALPYEVAENGQIALEMAQKNNYDLILMDLQMPEMNGYEATTEIRKFNTNTPIVALTASAIAEVKSRIESAGMNGAITKPFVPNDLKKSVMKYLTLGIKKGTKDAEKFQEAR